MRSLRPEQIILLLVILVPLLNLLVRWLQRRARAQRGPEPVVRGERAPTPMLPRPRVIEPALTDETRHREAAPRKVPPAPRPGNRRTAPLRGRAAIRRAVVAMTILGSCRGLGGAAAIPFARPRFVNLPRPVNRVGGRSAGER